MDEEIFYSKNREGEEFTVRLEDFGIWFQLNTYDQSFVLTKAKAKKLAQALLKAAKE